MPEKTYKIIEVVGVSDGSVDEAVRNAITKARKPCTTLIGSK